MYEITRQERLALIVIALLITGGTVARHAVHRAEAREALQFTAEAADTLRAESARSLRERVAGELERERLRSRPLAEGERIDPNTASAEQLDRLPGVGPAIAARILEVRERNGRFRSLNDLAAVPGVGPAMLQRVAPHLALPSASPGGAGDAVDINRASLAELDRLPGIGPAIAQRIIDYRNAHGRFREWEDLENVSGIGPRVRERLQGAARLTP